MKTQGTIRRIIERDDRLLVSLPQHDGYFQALDPAQWPVLKAAEADGRAVAFDYDFDLVIANLST